ncbi:BolA/IbaG family iron-sulfur metabolism protein [Psychromonas sp. MME2]|uniref:BolA family protein n=1 Tax=unclassified Psychromonas TaxID=2614957 RepID=UPI00339C358C
MKIEEIIERKIKNNMQVVFLQIDNESYRHSVPKDSETHFKVVLVSTDFANMRLLERHRLINDLLKEELAGPVHALALHTYTPEQWQLREQQLPQSSQCLGGSK